MNDPIIERAKALVVGVDRDLATSLMIMYATGCPAWAPTGSRLAPFVRANGCLNDHGRLVAVAWLVLDDETTDAGRERARRVVAESMEIV